MTFAKITQPARIFILSLVLCPAVALGAPPGNDNFAGAALIAGASGSVNGTNVESTRETGEPNHAQSVEVPANGRSVWWRWTASGTGVATFDTAGSDYDTVISVYTGPAVDGLTLVGEGDDTSFVVFTSRVAFQATAGVTYQIAVDGFDGDTGAITLAWQLGGPAPANDNFAGGTLIPPAGGAASGSNVNATKEPGEPWHAHIAGGSSVWWRWTPGASGVYEIDTMGSGFDTLLAVYTGDSVGALEAKEFNDDVDPDVIKVSRLTLSAVAGTTYHIAVDGYGFESGDISVMIAESDGTPPANDNFADRGSISPAGGSVTGDSLYATKESGEPVHPDNIGGRSVWWTWTPSVSATVSLSTAGSDFDTILAVHTGSALGALALVVHNDDESALTQTSYVTFDAVAGTAYQIVVDGYDGDSGSVLLTLNPVNFVPIAPIANPAAAVTSREFIAAWTPVGGASGYRLDVSTNSGFVNFVSGYENLDLGTANLRVVSGLAPSTSHYYRVRAYNSAGTSLSSQTVIATTAAAAFSGLVNISTLAVAGSGDATLIVGFFIAGTTSKTLVIRGVGPQLAKPPINRTNAVVADPRITLYREETNSSTVVATNEDWDPSLAADFNAVGAFGLETGSKDAAMKVTLNPGRYTVHLVNGGAPAEAIIEVYDRSKETTSRLVNLSCRLNLGAGQTIIVGAYQENRIGPLLMRNIGPTLATYSVQGALPDPELALFNSGDALIDRNDDWDNTLQTYFGPTGAFPLDLGSKDAVLRETMLPGRFTMHATGKGSSGVTLVELYESQ